MGHMRVCTICKHPKREEIDHSIIAGESVRDIGGQFHVSKSAVDRHKPHISALVAAHGLDRAESLERDIHTARGRAEALYAVAGNILQAAVTAGDPRSAMQAIRTATQVLGEARNLMELRSEVESQQQHSPEDRAVEIEVSELIKQRDVRVRAEARAELLAELGLPAPVQALN